MGTRRFAILVLTMVIPLVAWCQTEGTYFSFTTDEGIEVSFCGFGNPGVCSVENKADDIGFLPPAAINTSTTGSISIPETVYYNGESYDVLYIGLNAFSYCQQLNAVTLPEYIVMISEGAFYGCQNLKSINLPPKVKYKYWSSEHTFHIGQNAFSSCSSLTKIELPEGLDVLLPYTFDGCSSLKSISLPSTLETIEHGVFQDCSSLSTITIKAATPPTVAEDAFGDCSGITLYVPNGSKAAYETADHWKNFKEIIEDASLSIISFADANVKQLCVANWDTNDDGELDEAEAAAVTDLGQVFKWIPVENETSYDIQSFDELKYFTGLTSIGEDAFFGCSMMKTLTLPSSVTSIGQSAFYGCRGLLSITIPETVTTIGGLAFYGCSSLTSFNVPSSVKNIGICPIKNCTKITSITVDSDNPYYDSREGCNAIIRTSDNTLIAGCQSSFIPNTVTAMANYAFEECEGLTSIVIPASVASIPEKAFGSCLALETVTISNGVQTIGANAFYGCKKISSLNIPASVTSIMDYAFQGCTGLTNIVVASGNTVYDSRKDCNAIIQTASNTLIKASQNAVIPNDVTAIGLNAFAGLKNITSVDIPETVTSIGPWAFSNCTDLVSVIIPSGVTSIGQAAFYGCNSLAKVKSKITTPFFIGEKVFQYYNNKTNKTEFTLAKLIVPSGCKAAYEAMDNWNKFSVIDEVGKCARPTISLVDGKLHFECETEGVTYKTRCSYESTSSDVNVGDFVPGGTTVCHVTVYATKEDYEDSEPATLDLELNVGKKGDVNSDGKVSITDAVSVVNMILNSGTGD